MRTSYQFERVCGGNDESSSVATVAETYIQQYPLLKDKKQPLVVPLKVTSSKP